MILNEDLKLGPRDTESKSKTVALDENLANEIRANKINKLNEIKRKLDALSKQVQKYMDQKERLKEIRKKLKEQLKANKKELKRTNKDLKLAKNKKKRFSKNYDQESRLLNQVTADFKISNNTQVDPSIYSLKQKQYKKVKKA